jgi:excisionase family DNA binding protein
MLCQAFCFVGTLGEEIVSQREKPIIASPRLDLLTLAETAAVLKVSRKAVSAWVNQGALRAIRLGPGKRLIRIRRGDLEEFIAQGEITTDPSD